MDFTFESDLNCAVKIDSPLARLPLARWQRKAMEKVEGSFNLSVRSKDSSALSLSSSNVTNFKTPNKDEGINLNKYQKRKTHRKSPSRSKSPSDGGEDLRFVPNQFQGIFKTPNKDEGIDLSKNQNRKLQNKTPSRSKSPADGGEDIRLIPNRSITNFELAQFKLSQQENDYNAGNVDSKTQDYQKAIADNLNGSDFNNLKILSYGKKPPICPESHLNSLKVVYSTSKSHSSVKKSNRFIPQAPERVLDAPQLSDDYYLNLIDWSCTNILAVALANSVYLWNASTGQIDKLLELETPADYVTAVTWNADGSYITAGLSDSTIQIWDPTVSKKIRTMRGHSARVGCLSWNEHILSSGCRNGSIHHHDVRVAEHLITKLTEHTKEVCGLKWSPDGKYLAAGSNDNTITIWPSIPGRYYTHTEPLYIFSEHQAAVKGLAWCPWQPNILATGGGTADRCLKIWNCNIGSCINSVDTQSQVCSILWSKEYKELVTGHGFVNNQLIIWKYPTMSRIAELVGHTSRVLHMAMSPDGQTVVSAAADETLRFWKCFGSDPTSKKTTQEKGVSRTSSQMGFYTIR